jgi:hypothetical protein
MARTRRGAVPVDAYVRYLRELRVGDLLHVESGVIAVEDGDIVTGHKLFDSDDSAVCATVELRTRHVELAGRVPVPLSPAQEAAARARQVDWDGPPRERRPVPKSDAGFVEAGREFVKPWEIDTYGQSAMSSTSTLRGANATSSPPSDDAGLPAGTARGLHSSSGSSSWRPARGRSVVVRRTPAWDRRRCASFRMSNPRTGSFATLDQLDVHLDMDARRHPPRRPETRAQAIKSPPRLSTWGPRALKPPRSGRWAAVAPSLRSF